MIYRDIVQGSQEWFDIRLGKVTASRVVDIIPGVKGRYLAGRKNYMAELIAEILTGKQEESFISGPMQWGIDTEPLARSAYEAKTGYMVDEVGFATHPTIERFGASPDGLTDHDLGQEIKCPNTATHLDVVLRGKAAVKRAYIIQMNVNMMCTERDRWHYVDFDPRLPDKHSLVIIAYDRDKVLCAEIEMEVKKFWNELNAMLKALEAIE